MNADQIASLAHRAIYIAAIVSMPILLVCLAIGVIISVFQAATQIHEQSLTFVPKIVGLILVLAIAGTWMATQLGDLFRTAFSSIAGVQ